MNLGVSIALIAIIIALIIVSPIISIWAFNTLFVGVVFKQAIELTIWTYLAMVWFSGVIAAGGRALTSSK